MRPASTRRGPTVRQSREPFFNPRRILTETGRSTASAIAATMRHARSGSSSSVAPAPVFVTFLTGQPKLTSTMSAPAAATIFAASAIVLGVRAEELDRKRVLVRGNPQIPERLLVAVLDSGAGDHFGADEAGPESASLPPERLHADAGHRRKDEPGRHVDRADLPALAKTGSSSRQSVAMGTNGRCRLRVRRRGSYPSRPS